MQNKLTKETQQYMHKFFMEYSTPRFIDESIEVVSNLPNIFLAVHKNIINKFNNIVKSDNNG